MSQHGTLGSETTAQLRVLARQFDENFWRAKFLKPETNFCGRRFRAVFKIVCFNETTQHRPVFVALRFLGSHEIG